MTTMLFLGRALDLLQNGGITSGNDVFFVVFWTLHGNAKYLVMMFMDKKVKRCFRNSLAACAAFASEFGQLWCNFIFLDVHVVCQQQQTNLFFCQTAFCIFLEAA